MLGLGEDAAARDPREGLDFHQGGVPHRACETFHHLGGGKEGEEGHCLDGKVLKRARRQAAVSGKDTPGTGGYAACTAMVPTPKASCLSPDPHPFFSSSSPLSLRPSLPPSLPRPCGCASRGASSHGPSACLPPLPFPPCPLTGCTAAYRSDGVSRHHWSSLLPPPPRTSAPKQDDLAPGRGHGTERKNKRRNPGSLAFRSPPNSKAWSAPWHPRLRLYRHWPVQGKGRAGRYVRDMRGPGGKSEEGKKRQMRGLNRDLHRRADINVHLESLRHRCTSRP